jgi:hypothetical protein
VGDYPGQEERACTIENNTIIRNTYVDHTGSIKTYPGPGFIGGLPSKALYTVYEVDFYVPNPPKGFETWAEETAGRAMGNLARRNSWINEYIESGMAYIIPEGLSAPIGLIYEKNKAEISKVTYDSIKAAITGEMSVGDAIDHYRETARALGVKDVLAVNNAKLGKATD